MSHSYSQNVVHLVFSTKNRAASIPNEFQPDLWAYIAAICQRQDILVHVVGGMPDHIHLLLQIPSTMSLAKCVETIKANSSKWAGEKGHRFSWQSGYAAFSVSASIVPAVVRYIKNQAAHHKKMNFAEEFVALLKKHGVAYDPKFVLG
jgi:REP element-mobilizing transposase RayT